MKKIIKNNWRFIIAIVFVLAIITFILIEIYNLKPPDKNDTEKYFLEDKEKLIFLTEYFENYDYEEIYVDKSNLKNGTMFTGSNTKDVNIDDESLLNLLNELMKNRNYKSIKKDGNTISFEKWSLGEKSYGIAYSINKKDKPEIEYLTKLESLSEPGWYYYKSDYNEWRNFK